MVLHAKLYKSGDKYDVLGLKDLSREKFARACAKYWNDDQLPTAANHAFTTTTEDDKGLRDI
jgi:lipoprotein NlpI